MRGKSWMPYFGRQKKTDEDEMWYIHMSSEPIGWELFARGALRKGEWKIVHLEKRHGGAGVGDEGWELFNVVKDPGETKDLSDSEPGKLKELLACWDEYVMDCGIIWGEKADAPGQSREQAPELWEDDVELQQTWMGATGGACPL